MKPNASFKLKIVAGLHKDAELFLEPGLVYTVGSGDPCDIILLDAGVTQMHLGLTVNEGKIWVESTQSEIFLDGQLAPYTAFELSPFQVVSIGDAHLVVGPAEQAWPPITVPQFNTATDEPICTDLVLFDADANLPDVIRRPGFFHRAWKNVRAWLSVSDKKVLIAVGVFVIAFMIFVIDASLNVPPTPPATSNASLAENTPNSTSQSQKKGMLLAAVDGLQSMKIRTLVGAGISEPRIAIQSSSEQPSNDPVNQIRSALKHIWGDNLIETRKADHSIAFKGFSPEDQQNLTLEIKKNEHGEWIASGVTGTWKRKQAILSRLGDAMRVKIDVTGEVETACRRVLKKKGVRRPEARFDMAEKSVILQGRSKDSKTISKARAIVSRTFPEIDVRNKIKVGAVRARPNISGVSTSGAPHVILSDGSKVFKGGKLDNGCAIIGIKNDHVTLNCNGSRTTHRL